MQMTSSFETSGATCPVTQRHVPEDLNPRFRGSQNSDILSACLIQEGPQ